MADHRTTGGSWIFNIPLITKKMLRDSMTVQELTHLQQLLDKRKILMQKYSGEDISGTLEKLFTPNARKVTKLPEQNIIDRAIRRISLVYKNMPEYVYRPSKLPENYDSARRWGFMKETERIGNLLGTLIARPLVKMNDDGKAFMDWERIWTYIPFFGENPFEPVAVIYPISTASAEMVTRTGIRWQYWDREKTIIFDANGKTEKEEPNPYKALPFVSAHVRPQTTSYWVTGYGKALADANDAMNISLMEQRLGVRLNLMGQWSVSGMNDPKAKFELGVDQVPQLPAGVTLNVDAPTSDMDGAIAQVKLEIENTMLNLGLHVIWSEGQGVPSGESLKVRNFELLERREDDVLIWKMFDDALYEKEKIIWAATQELENKLPEFRAINFTEIEFPISTIDRQLRDDWRLDHGVQSIVDVVLNLNPDIMSDVEDQDKRRDAIVEHINRNKAENAATGILRETDEPSEATMLFERRAINGSVVAP